MSEALLYLDRASSLNLQAQIRQKLVEAIDLEVLKPGSRLRSLGAAVLPARLLDRNTIRGN